MHQRNDLKHFKNRGNPRESGMPEEGKIELSMFLFYFLFFLCFFSRGGGVSRGLVQHSALHTQSTSRYKDTVNEGILFSLLFSSLYHDVMVAPYPSLSQIKQT